jgi:hypothetical protein
MATKHMYGTSAKLWNNHLIRSARKELLRSIKRSRSIVMCCISIEVASSWAWRPNCTFSNSIILATSFFVGPILGYLQTPYEMFGLVGNQDEFTNEHYEFMK